MTTLTAGETTSLRRALLGVAIVALALSALMGVVALLSGGAFGATEGRILLTTLVVGCASVSLLCYLATAGTRYVLVGVVGGMLLLLPVVTALRLIWTDWDSFPGDGWVQALLIGIVFALTFAQASLLLGLAGSRPSLRGLLWPTLALAAAVAAVLVALILEEIDIESVWRVLGVIAILDVFGTLVTIVLARFGRSGAVPGSLRVPAGLEAGLVARAESEGRNAGDLLTEALERYLRGN